MVSRAHLFAVRDDTGDNYVAENADTRFRTRLQLDCSAPPEVPVTDSRGIPWLVLLLAAASSVVLARAGCRSPIGWRRSHGPPRGNEIPAEETPGCVPPPGICYGTTPSKSNCTEGDSS